MKIPLLVGALILAAGALACWFVPEAPSWAGVDESVVGRFASEAGRPPARPLLDTEQGDLHLFVFLLAGAAGGFVVGGAYRELFPRSAGAGRVAHGAH